MPFLGTAAAFALRNWTWLLIGALVLALKVQGGWLHKARANLHDPASGRTWKAEAVEARKAIDDPKSGWRVRLDQCHANVGALTGALEAQKTAVQALQARSAQSLADNLHARQAAALGIGRARSDETRILAPPTVSEVCAKAEEVDHRFVESLR